MVVEELNPNGPSPLYHQLFLLLQEQLNNGVWKPGDKLPTEDELCRQFNLSRTTVRHTLARLEQSGVIERRPGIGTRVVKPKIKELLLTNVTGSFAGKYSGNDRYGTRVIEKSIRKASEKVAEKLALNGNVDVIEISRVRMVDNESLFWSTAYVPYDLCPEFIHKDFQTHSFFEILKNDFGIAPSSAVRTIEAYNANHLDVEYLGVKLGAPMHLVESISFLEDHSPFEYSLNHYRGDRSRFEVLVSPGMNDSEAINRQNKE